MLFTKNLLAATSENTTKLLKFNRLIRISTRRNVLRCIVLTLLLFPLISGCNNKFEVYEITKVKTLEVSSVTATEATLQGELVSIGRQPILDHGFLWSTNEKFDINSEQRVSMGAISSKGTFSHQWTNLNIGQTYYIKAYVQYGNGMLIGSTTGFMTLER